MNLVLVAGFLITVVTAIPVLLQLRSHPRGLFVLFFAEMWERFSYYGMRGLLIFYLTKHFLFDTKVANGQYGAYTTLVFLTPLIGGVIADRFIGTRRAVAFGALLLVAGHLTMAVEGAPARQVLSYQGQSYSFQTEGPNQDAHAKLKIGGALYDYAPAADGGLDIKGLPAIAPLPSHLPKDAFKLTVADRDPHYVDFFYLALSLIVMGVGFLKANISSIVGQLYTLEDPRRDAGFTLYYYGINLGAFWAGVLCGWLGESIGWWAGFGAAGLGMLAGFIVFVLGRPLLQGKGEAPDEAKLTRPILGPINREHIIYALGLVGVAGTFFLVRSVDVVGGLLGAGSVAILAYVAWQMATRCTPRERARLTLALVLIAGSVVFWTLFEQAGSSMNLLADRNVDLSLIAHPYRFSLLGHEVLVGSREMLAQAGLDPARAWWIDMNFTAAQTQSLEPGFLLLFAPVFAGLWAWLGRRGRDPNPVLKFGLALVQVGLGLLFLVWAAPLADAQYRLPLAVLALAYMIHATGELCLSPVGMSEVTKLSPATLISTMIAVWFLALSWAEWLGGLIAKLASTESVAGQVLDPKTSLFSFLHVYNWLGWGAAGVGVVVLLLSPYLKKLGQDPDAPSAPGPGRLAPTPGGDRQNAHA